MKILVYQNDNNSQRLHDAYYVYNTEHCIAINSFNPHGNSKRKELVLSPVYG